MPSNARANARSPELNHRRSRARGTRSTRARCARRVPKDPKTFANGDYDEMRAELAREGGRTGGMGISATLNWLSAVAFGTPERRKAFEAFEVDEIGKAYGRFIDGLPYRRQDGRRAKTNGGMSSIDDARNRLFGDGKTLEVTTRGWVSENELRGVEAYWRERGASDGFATYAAERVLTLSTAVRDGKIGGNDEGIKALTADVFALSARAETVAAICVCSVPEALKLAYEYPEILCTPSSAIVSRLSALKMMMPGADVALIVRRNAKAFLERDVNDIKRRFDALQRAFPGVKVSKLVEHDPELLLIDVDAGVAALRDLWTPEQFAGSDDDNPFFAEELALAIRAVSGNGPEQYGG